MPLSDHDRAVLEQLELTLQEESDHLTRIARKHGRRRKLALVTVAVQLLAGLMLMPLGLGLRDAVGAALATFGYLMIVAAGYGAVNVIRAARPGSPARIL